MDINGINAPISTKQAFDLRPLPPPPSNIDKESELKKIAESNSVNSSQSVETKLPQEINHYQEPSTVNTFVAANPLALEDDAISQFMAEQLNYQSTNPPSQNRDKPALHTAMSGMSKIGDVLKLAITGDSNKIDESYRMYSYQQMHAEQVSPDFSTIDHIGVSEVFRLSFDLTTKEGDTIHLNLSYKQGKEPPFVGFDLSYKMDGELSETEQEQLEKLASRMNLFTQSYYYGDRVSLQALPLDSLDAFAKIDMQLWDQRDHDKGDSDLSKTATPRSLRLRFENSELGKTLEVNNKYITKGDGVMDNPDIINDRIVTTDTIKLILDIPSIEGIKDEDSKQQAIMAYIEKIRQSADESNASEKMKKLMIESLYWMNEGNEHQGLSTQDNVETFASQDTPINKSKEDKPVLASEISSIKEQPMLTGLDDFNFQANTNKTMEATGAGIGNSNKLHEKFEFNLNFSQKTELKESEIGLGTEVQQTQTFELRSSYHKAARDAFMFSPDFENQSYRYFDVYQKEEIISSQNYDIQGELTLANLQHNYEINSTMREFRFGELVDEEENKEQKNDVKDVTATLLAKQSQQQLDIIKGTLISPFSH